MKRFSGGNHGEARSWEYLIFNCTNYKRRIISKVFCYIAAIILCAESSLLHKSLRELGDGVDEILHLVAIKVDKKGFKSNLNSFSMVTMGNEVILPMENISYVISTIKTTL